MASERYPPERLTGPSDGSMVFTLERGSQQSQEGQDELMSGVVREYLQGGQSPRSLDLKDSDRPDARRRHDACGWNAAPTAGSLAGGRRCMARRSCRIWGEYVRLWRA
jgi:hypothetical protein